MLRVIILKDNQRTQLHFRLCAAVQFKFILKVMKKTKKTISWLTLDRTDGRYQSSISRPPTMLFNNNSSYAFARHLFFPPSRRCRVEWNWKIFQPEISCWLSTKCIVCFSSLLLKLIKPILHLVFSLRRFWGVLKWLRKQENKKKSFSVLLNHPHGSSTINLRKSPCSRYRS